MVSGDGEVVVESVSEVGSVQVERDLRIEYTPRLASNGDVKIYYNWSERGRKPKRKYGGKVEISAFAPEVITARLSEFISRSKYAENIRAQMGRDERHRDSGHSHQHATDGEVSVSNPILEFAR